MLEGKTPKQAARIRILDPACGSGSFLIGAYQYLLDWYRDRYIADGVKKHRDVMYQGAAGTWRLAANERKRILRDSIFGVDIDPQAVEVTKLSLLLKVLEGETGQTLAIQPRLIQDRALPDLGGNIKCGNSLIAGDFYDNTELPGLVEDDYHRVNAFDWDKGFPWMREAGRFDAVIGNPPYIRIQRIDHDQADYLFRVYETPASKTDLSQLFMEQSLKLVSDDGLVGFICTSQWLTTDYGKNMRRALSGGRLHEIVDFGSLPVFKNADTYPAIFILSNFEVASMNVKTIGTIKGLNLKAIEDAPTKTIPLESLRACRESYLSSLLTSRRAIRWIIASLTNASLLAIVSS